jgi:transcriptional regulator of arginine metabolism
MPTDLRQQIARREAIVQILGNSEITRQDDLVRALADRGLGATQSSISRDLKELGVAKVGERYVAPQNVRVPGNPPFELLAGFVKNLAAAGPNITVIRTATGAAQSVAVALDEAGWAEIVGTISGDDTIFVATATLRQQQMLLARLDATFPGARRS